MLEGNLCQLIAKIVLVFDTFEYDSSSQLVSYNKHLAKCSNGFILTQFAIRCNTSNQRRIKTEKDHGYNEKRNNFQIQITKNLIF